MDVRCIKQEVTEPWIKEEVDGINEIDEAENEYKLESYFTEEEMPILSVKYEPEEEDCSTNSPDADYSHISGEVNHENTKLLSNGASQQEHSHSVYECGFCKIEFNSHDYEVHMNKHNIEIFFCNYCDRGFFNDKNLILHKCYVHSEHQDLDCVNNVSTMNDKGDHEKVKNNVKGDQDCVVDEFESESESEDEDDDDDQLDCGKGVIRRMRNKIEKKLTDGATTRSSWNKKKEVIRPLPDRTKGAPGEIMRGRDRPPKRENIQPGRPRVSPKVFRRTPGVAKKAVLRQKASASKDVITFRCVVCASVFKKFQCYEKHLKKHYDLHTFSCDDCFERFSNKPDWLQHKRVCAVGSRVSALPDEVSDDETFDPDQPDQFITLEEAKVLQEEIEKGNSKRTMRQRTMGHFDVVYLN